MSSWSTAVPAPSPPVAARRPSTRPARPPATTSSVPTGEEHSAPFLPCGGSSMSHFVSLRKRRGLTLMQLLVLLALLLFLLGFLLAAAARFRNASEGVISR